MRSVFLLCLLLLLVPFARAQSFTVLVYNVDNLTAADGHSQSDEYVISRYSREHLLTKLNNIAKVVARIDEGRGPDVILFQEIERDFAMDQYLFDHAGMLRHYESTAIEDMLRRGFNKDVARIPVEGLLLKMLYDRGMRGYRVASADDALQEPTRRHITHLNVIFSRLPIRAVRTHLLRGMPATLEVELQAGIYPLYVFNNHWKGDTMKEEGEDLRVAAAKKIRERIDEILEARPYADIIVAGDFNCFYNQGPRFKFDTTAITDVLGSMSDERALRSSNGLYNLWYELPPGERGSEYFHGVWSTFMQIMVSRGLYDFRGVQYVDDSFGVAQFDDLNATPDGLPWRWSFKGNGSGFSDHFPIYARFTTVRNNRENLYMTLPDKPRWVEDGGRRKR